MYIYIHTIIHICVFLEEYCLNTVEREGLLHKHQFHSCRCSHPKKALLRWIFYLNIICSSMTCKKASEIQGDQDRLLDLHGTLIRWPILGRRCPFHPLALQGEQARKVQLWVGWWCPRRQSWVGWVIGMALQTCPTSRQKGISPRVLQDDPGDWPLTTCSHRMLKQYFGSRGSSEISGILPWKQIAQVAQVSWR